MKMTLRDINKHYAELTALSDMTFPAKLGFAVAKNITRMETDIRTLAKEKEKLLKQYADKDEEGNPLTVKKTVGGKELTEYQINEANTAKFNSDLADLMETEVETDIHMISRELLESCAEGNRYTTPSVRTYVSLEFMLQD